MPHHITLLIPGLFGDQRIHSDRPALTGLSAPALVYLLDRAKRIPGLAGGLEQVAGHLFGMTETPLSCAALTQLVDYEGDTGQQENSLWMRADPVSLRADRDRIVMLDTACLGITRQEADDWVSQINEQLSGDGWRLEAPQLDRWYLRLTDLPHLTTTPPSRVIGQDIHPFMVQGKDQRVWRKLMNEIQMLLHASEPNLLRSRAGRPTVNSLWFWGEGRIGNAGRCPWVRVWSDQSLFRGLAKHHGVTREALPDDAQTWLAGQPVSGEHLIVFDQSVSLLALGKVEQWHDFVELFDKQWLAPQIEALRNGVIDKITLCPLDGFSYLLTVKQLKRWWPLSWS